MTEYTVEDRPPVEEKCKQYPYFRLSTYEVYGSAEYGVLCDMFLKYYAGRMPVCLALHSQAVNPNLFAAIWLIGKEVCDPKTKSKPNSEPMGEIIFQSNWPNERGGQ